MLRHVNRTKFVNFEAKMGRPTSKTVVGIVSFAMLVGAYIYRRSVQLETERMTAVLGGLLKTESEASLSQGLRVAVGFGSCVDMIVPGLDILGRLGAVPPDKPHHYDSLQDMDELERIFAYFFRYGAAADISSLLLECWFKPFIAGEPQVSIQSWQLNGRYMANASLFDSMVDIAKSVLGTKVAVGGNAPVMVNCFLREGVRVLLGAQMTENLRLQISPDVEVAGDRVSEDDIHLIMEYKKGDKWGSYEAPRSNRFIVHHDDNNPMLSSLEKFDAAVQTFSPHLVIVSGLQMLDNFPFQPGLQAILGITPDKRSELIFPYDIGNS